MDSNKYKVPDSISLMLERFSTDVRGSLGTTSSAMVKCSLLHQGHKTNSSIIATPPPSFPCSYLSRISFFSTDITHSKPSTPLSCSSSTSLPGASSNHSITESSHGLLLVAFLPARWKSDLVQLLSKAPLIRLSGAATCCMAFPLQEADRQPHRQNFARCHPIFAFRSNR